VQIGEELSAIHLEAHYSNRSVSKKDDLTTVILANRWRFWKLLGGFHLVQTLFWVKKPRFEPRLVGLYINSGESGARKLAVGHRILRLREEKEQGD